MQITDEQVETEWKRTINEIAAKRKKKRPLSAASKPDVALPVTKEDYSNLLIDFLTYKLSRDVVTYFDIKNVLSHLTKDRKRNVKMSISMITKMGQTIAEMTTGKPIKLPTGISVVIRKRRRGNDPLRVTHASSHRRALWIARRVDEHGNIVRKDENVGQPNDNGESEGID